MALYTIQDDERKIDILTDHVTIIYELPSINMLFLDNGQQLEITDTQRDEILDLLK